MNRRSGALFTALYLKQCAVTLQQAYGGITPYDIHTKLSVPVSLTRSGYPRIIPSFHRQQIYKRDDKADMLVKLYFSFFSLSRAIKLAKRISPSLFASITDPMSDVKKFSEVRDWLRGLIRKLANRYLSQAPFTREYRGNRLGRLCQRIVSDLVSLAVKEAYLPILHQSYCGSLCSVYRCLLTLH